MKKNSGLRSGIVVLVLLLAVGFAAVTTQLVINGTINIGANTSDFIDNIQFYTATATGESEKSGESSASVSGTYSRVLTFTTQELDKIGEKSVLTYTIKNGSMYDALLGDMKCVFGSYDEDTFPSSGAALSLTDSTGHITIKSNNELSGTTLAKKPANGSYTSSDSATVEVEMIKSYVGNGVDSSENSKTITFSCMLSATAVAE